MKDSVLFTEERMGKELHRFSVVMRINQSVGSAKMTYFVDATSAEAAKKLVIAQRKRAFNEAHGRVPEAYVVLGKVNDYGVVENGARRD